MEINKIKQTLRIVYRVIIDKLCRYNLTQYRLIENTHNFIRNLLKSEIVHINGYKLILDPNDDSLGLSINDMYEKSETSYFINNIKKGDVVVDIGANIGYFTLLFSNLVGDTGRVFAFEPSQDVFDILQKNIKLNNCENVELINKAVSDKTGKIDLYVSSGGSSDNRVYDSNDNRSKISIHAISLDDFFEHYHGNINYIKTDTQGAEYQVIKGMSNLLKKKNDIKIMSEFFPQGLAECGITPYEYYDLLKKYGFKMYELDGVKYLYEVSIHDLLNKYLNRYTSILCIKSI